MMYLTTILSLNVFPPSTKTQPPSNGAVYSENKVEKTEQGQTPGRNVSTTAGKSLQLGSLLSLVFSLPSPSRLLNLANFSINTFLLLASIEFIATPWFDDAASVTFTRLGAIYPDGAKIVIRYPLENATTHSLYVVYREVSGSGTTGADDWKDGPHADLTLGNDWTTTVQVGGLWPNTSYEYLLRDCETKTFTDYPTTPIVFRTFPDPRLPTGSHFRFIVSSCATPNFPYTPLNGRRIKGFDLLADYLWPEKGSVPSPHSSQANLTESNEDLLVTNNATIDGSSQPTMVPTTEITDAPTSIPAEFMLFLGDFIYADVPLYFGDEQEAYRRLYRRNYLSPSFRKVFERLPMLHAYDDHEIRDNFAGQGNDSTPPFPNAADAFRLYNADANYDSHGNNSHYYEFRYADVAFFVLDTRRYRSDAHTVDIASRTMLGETQLAALYDWLGRVNNTATFKFIVSSVPFTSLWQHDAVHDSWAGYANEKAALVDALHTIPNVIILSGDRHEFAAIEFTGEGTGHKFIEVSTSPLSMFYVPFVRTLQLVSPHLVRRLVENPTSSDASEVIEVEIPQEQVLKAIATGNYKWSSFEVDTRDVDHPTVYLEVMIDGHKAYGLTIAGQPVPLQAQTTALGSLLPEGFKGILDRIGLVPTRWF